MNMRLPRQAGSLSYAEIAFSNTTLARALQGRRVLARIIHEPAGHLKKEPFSPWHLVI